MENLIHQPKAFKRLVEFVNKSEKLQPKGLMIQEITLRNARGFDENSFFSGPRRNSTISSTFNDSHSGGNSIFMHDK